MPAHTTANHRARTLAGRLQILGLGMLSVLSAFFLGIQTAGEVDTVSQTAALGQYRTGDINGDGVTDTHDAILILQLLQNGDTPTTEQLLADPDEDGLLTIEDALLILRESVSRRP